MSKISKLGSFLLSVAILAFSGWVVLNRQFVLDHVRAWQFQPSAEIMQLATNAGMSEHGRFQFYVTQPRLESSNEFNAECRRSEKPVQFWVVTSPGKILFISTMYQTLNLTASKR